MIIEGENGMKFLCRKIHNFIIKMRCKLDPVKYAKSIGVRVGTGTKFYAPSSDMFSTEL